MYIMPSSERRGRRNRRADGATPKLRPLFCTDCCLQGWARGDLFACLDDLSLKRHANTSPTSSITRAREMGMSTGADVGKLGHGNFCPGRQTLSQWMTSLPTEHPGFSPPSKPVDLSRRLPPHQTRERRQRHTLLKWNRFEPSFTSILFVSLAPRQGGSLCRQRCRQPPVDADADLPGGRPIESLGEERRRAEGLPCCPASRHRN